MTPNPMVAMAAPAPDTRYAPRELPRFESRFEGKSFASRLNQAEATHKRGLAPRGVDEKQSHGKSEGPAAASKDTSAMGKSEMKLPEAEAKLSEAVAAETPSETPVAVSELSSVALMAAQVQAPTPAPAPEALKATGQEAGVPEALVDAEAVAMTEAAATEVGEKPKASEAAATEVGEKPKASEAPKADRLSEETEDAESPEPEKAKVAVKPVARQTVPSSLEGLRAEKGLMSLRNSLDDAPRIETKPASAKPEPKVVPESLDDVSATVVESDAPEAASVKPWEVTEPVRGGAEVSASKSEAAAIKAEPVPVKEAITRTFMQVQKTPDRPAELRLQLNPEHLGHLEVRVKAQEGAVSAVIRVEHQAVREMIETQLASLRASLAEQGIKIDRLEVSVNQQGARDQQAAAGFDFSRQAFDQSGQQGSSGQNRQGTSASWDPWVLETTDEMAVPAAIAESGFDAQA